MGNAGLKKRKDEFLGFAFALLNVKNAFKDLTTAQDQLVELKVVLADTAAYDGVSVNSIPTSDGPDYVLHRSVKKFGQTFLLSWNSTQQFDSTQPFRARWIILAIGLLVTVLVSSILQVLLKRNRTVAAIVAQKTRDLETQDKEKRSILENAMLAILSVNNSGKILHANDAAVKLLAPMTGRMGLNEKSLSELLPDIDLLAADVWLRIHLPSGSKDADPLVIEVEKKTWVTAEGEARTTLLMRDITVTERHAQAIAQAEQRWNLALRSAQIGVFDIDLHHETSVVSETWLENMQIEDLPDCKNPYREQMTRIHPDDLVAFKRAEAACIEGRTDRAVVRFRVNVGNDEWRWIKSDAVVVESAPDGRPIRMLGIQMDVTESFKLQRMKRDFVSTVSHELRTPLTSIKGALKLLQAQLQAEKPIGTERLIEIASINSDRKAYPFRSGRPTC